MVALVANVAVESDWTGRLGGLILISWVVEVMVGVVIRVFGSGSGHDYC